MLRILVVCLAVMILGSQVTLASEGEGIDIEGTVEDAGSTKDGNKDVVKKNKGSNQILMYRMLNDQTKDPTTSLYYRRWKKQRKLEWLNLQWFSNHKNLTVPGRMGDQGYENVRIPGNVDDEPL